MNHLTQTDSAAIGSADGAAQPSMLVLLGLLAGPFLTMIDASVVNVAAPSIVRSLHTDLATVQWTVSGYLLALATTLAATAWLTRRFGSRTVYVACLAAFTVASVLCALAPNIQLLIAMRAVQGLAGAPLIPISMSMMMGGSTGAARQIQRSGAAAAILLFLAPALGPSLGGILINAFGWPSIFLINLPFGLVGIIGALRIADRFNIPPDPAARLDPVGLTLLALGMSLALYGAGRGAAFGWTAPSIWPFWASGLLLVSAYVLWAWRRPQPVLSLSALRDRQIALSMALVTLVSIISFSALFLVPVLMQLIQGFSAFQAGLAMLPQGVMMGAGSALGGYVMKSGRIRLSVVLGSLTMVATTAAMLLIEVRTPGWETALILCGRGLAFGLITQPLLVGMLGSLSQAESADASTLFNVIQRLGGSFGIGLLASMFAVRSMSRVGDALKGLRDSGTSRIGGAAVENALGAAFHDVVWALVGVSALGILLALLLGARPFTALVGDSPAATTGPASPADAVS
ncbi:MAG TPA: DHA2 family efflux MFS transporter permease subunit [Candidatus Dormibacteraeota bacterium]|nr:DHA2 family efflux MFS transporter permease subunit [Candidatus Dormibacteraeota bacterium]